MAAVLAVVFVVGSVLLLSAAGMYAMMSFTVTQRRREIGVRSALGGSARHILVRVLGRAALQLGMGVMAGLGTGAVRPSYPAHRGAPLGVRIVNVGIAPPNVRVVMERLPVPTRSHHRHSPA